MRRILTCASVAAVAVSLAVAAPADATVVPATSSSNLIVNGNAESGPGSSDGSTVVVPGWTLTTGTAFTAVQYGASGGFPTATDPGPGNRGANFFAGGPGEDQETATQTINVKKYRTSIDAGTATYQLSGFLGGFASQNDQALVEVDWKSKAGELLGTATIGPVTAKNRKDLTGLLQRKLSGSVPPTTRTAFVQLSLSRAAGSYNDGYADNLALKIKTP